MPAEYTYDYAIIRVVPRVDRGERINVGVILSCADLDFLDARIELDIPRLAALDPTIDVEAMRTNLATIPAVCRGGGDAGPIGALPQRGRFRWLVSPRSTIIQMSGVHTGRTKDPAGRIGPSAGPCGETAFRRAAVTMCLGAELSGSFDGRRQLHATEESTWANPRRSGVQPGQILWTAIGLPPRRHLEVERSLLIGGQRNSVSGFNEG